MISLLKPLLDKHNVSLVGVGLEELGATQFVELGFFKGGIVHLLIDMSWDRIL